MKVKSFYNNMSEKSPSKQIPSVGPETSALDFPPLPPSWSNPNGLGIGSVPAPQEKIDDRPPIGIYPLEPFTGSGQGPGEVIAPGDEPIKPKK